MKRHDVIKYLVAMLIVTTALAGRVWAASPDTLSIGRATDKVTREHARLRPLVTYLAERLKGDGITRGRLVFEGENNNQRIINLLKSGELDLILESPFSAALYQKRTGAFPILLVSREGLVEYQSYIFVRKDSPIQTANDLVGRLVAFEDPTSTSSYQWPRQSLVEMGHALTPVSVGEPIPKEQIGYIFAGSELNIASWVFFGKVSAGCLSSADWLDPEENPQNFRDSFRIVHATKPIPRMFVMVRRDLPPRLIQRIQQEMLIMHAIPAGRDALRAYQIDRFIELAPDAKAILDALASD